MRNLVRLCCALAVASLITAASSPTAVRTQARARAAAGAINVNSTSDASQKDANDPPPPPPSLLIIVNSTSDVAANDGLCTLREAITAANTNSASGTASGECRAGGTDESIDFEVEGVINLTGALPAVSSTVIIDGPGSSRLTVRRDTGGDYRIFTIASGATVAISGLTVSNGKTPDDTTGSNNFAPGGGGIMNMGALTLTSVVVSGNSTGAGFTGPTGGHAGDGGGIYNSGTLTLTLFSTVSGNRTGKGGGGSFLAGNGGRGGGIFNESGTVTINSSTVSGNVTGDGGAALTGGGQFPGAGGGIYNNTNATTNINNSAVRDNVTGVFVSGAQGPAGGLLNEGTMTITGGHISGNTGAEVSGIWNASGSLNIANGTVSGNSTGVAIKLGDVQSAVTLTNCTVASNPGGGIVVTSPLAPVVRNTIIAGNGGSDVSGAFNSQGHNLVGNGDGATGFGASGNQVGSAATPVNPRLGPLADNGGQTKTHALLPGSPAIDAGDDALAKDASNNTLTSDGRGAPSPRFADGPDADAVQTVDIGAFEAHPTVEDIADKSMLEGSTLSFNFNVGSDSFGLSSVTATSSNTALVPNNAANISISGTGSQRTLSVTPAASAHGTTTITVTVMATNGRTASDTFLLTVLQSTTISSVSGSGVYAGTATLTATLTSGGSGLPGKTVVFMLNGSPAGSATTDAGGVATKTDVPLSGFNAGTFGGVVLAVFPGDANFGTSSGAGPLTVAKADTTTTVTASDATFDGNTHGATAVVTGPGGLNQSLSVIYTGDGPYGPTATPPKFVGGYTASASFAGDSNYNPSSDSEDFSIVKASQTITFDAIPDKTFGDANFSVSATATSGLPVSFAASGNCTVTAGSVHITGAGSCTITASQAGDESFNAAPDVSRSFQIAKAASATGLFSSSNPSGVGQPVSFSAFVTSGAGTPTGSVQFKSDGANLGSPVALDAGGVATLTTSSLTAGTHTITADYGGDANFASSSGTLAGGQGVAAGGVLGFNGNFIVGERSPGSVTVTVTRSGSTALAVDVDYATDEGSTPSVFVPCSAVTGTALDRCDYTKALGTLHFAAGESEKTFVVLINDDTYVEGEERADLRLSNPTGGAALGPRAVTSLIIGDDSPENFGNPLDDDANFVKQHYHDFLNREPDADGLAFWKNQMANCGNPNLEVCRVNVSAAFFKSIEFQETGYLVYRTYKVAYGDATSPGVPGTVPVVRFREFLSDTQRIGQGVQVGVGDWQTRLVENKNAYALEFVQRPRFTAEYPSTLTPSQFVEKLNANTGGVLTQDERDTLVNTLSSDNTTHGRSVILSVVAEKPLLRQREFNRAFVLMEYFGYLRRNPDDAPQPGLNYSGWKFWLDKLEQFNGNFVQAEMVKAFLASDEYRQRFAQ